MGAQAVPTQDGGLVSIFLDVIGIFFHFLNRHTLNWFLTWGGAAATRIRCIGILRFDIKGRDPLALSIQRRRHCVSEGVAQRLYHRIRAKLALVNKLNEYQRYVQINMRKIKCEYSGKKYENGISNPLGVKLRDRTDCESDMSSFQRDLTTDLSHP